MIPPVICKREKLYLPENCTDCEILEARVDALEDDKQDKLIAGSNIIINGNVISATGEGGETSYSTYSTSVAAGEGGVWTYTINGIGNRATNVAEAGTVRFYSSHVRQAVGTLINTIAYIQFTSCIIRDNQITYIFEYTGPGTSASNIYVVQPWGTEGVWNHS